VHSYTLLENLLVLFQCRIFKLLASSAPYEFIEQLAYRWLKTNAHIYIQLSIANYMAQFTDS